MYGYGLVRHNVRGISAKQRPFTLSRGRDYTEPTKDPVAETRPPRPTSNIFGSWAMAKRAKAPVLQNNDGSPGIYNQDAIPYESIMLYLFSVWRYPRNDVCARDGVFKRTDRSCSGKYSRDGYSWYREDMNPFLAVDENTTAWNNANLLQSALGSPIIVNDKLYFYLSAPTRLVDTAARLSLSPALRTHLSARRICAPRAAAGN